MNRTEIKMAMADGDLDRSMQTAVGEMRRRLERVLQDVARAEKTLTTDEAPHVKALRIKGVIHEFSQIVNGLDVTTWVENISASSAKLELLEDLMRED